MELEITPERKAYFDARGMVILNACPGSGKTSCIIHKLQHLEQECKKQYGAYCGIACLSFTNVAKDEILHKYKQTYGFDLQFPHLVSTIDSFINQFITLPYYNLLKKDYPRPQIVDQAGLIDKLVAVKFMWKGKLIDGIQAPMNKHKNKAGLPIFHSYAASKIWIDVNGHFTYEGKSPDPKFVDPAVFQTYGSDLLKWKLKKGLITSLDSAFIALHILKTHERIGGWLVKKFPYIIVDEAQDNSEIQHAIFDKLIAVGLKNIEMVGDPYQSLYEWRDAKPQLFLDKYKGTEWTGLPLSENRRSVQRIIDCFSIVRNSTDEKITSKGVVDLNIPIVVYKYNTTNPPLIVADFEQRCVQHKLKKNQIVVRGNSLKNRMLGNTSDVAPWKQYYPYTFLSVKHAFDTNHIKDAVNELRKTITELQNPDMDYHQLQELVNSRKEDYVLNGKLYDFLFKIPNSDYTLETWTNECLKLLKSNFAVDVAEKFEFKKKIDGYKMADLKQQKISVYFNKPASTKHNIPITTIHKVKGATLDAILFFLDETSNKESVTFKDFKLSDDFPSEKQRMIYVACSRPQQLLALALPDKITDADLKVKFGTDVEIIKL